MHRFSVVLEAFAKTFCYHPMYVVKENTGAFFVDVLLQNIQIKQRKTVKKILQLSNDIFNNKL